MHICQKSTHLHTHTHAFPCVAGVRYEQRGARKRWVVSAVGFLGWVLRQVRVCKQLSSDSQSAPMPACLVPVWKITGVEGTSFCRVVSLQNIHSQHANCKYSYIIIHKQYPNKLMMLFHHDEGKMCITHHKAHVCYQTGFLNTPITPSTLPPIVP